MNSQQIRLVVLLLSITFMAAKGQQVEHHNKLSLFADRDYCLSGDTIWFKVWQPSTLNPLGNVVRVHLNSLDNRLISSAAKQSKAGWAEGYLHVPDSLSTGQYFLSAFLNAQRHSTNLVTESMAITVYNRFADDVREITCLSVENRIDPEDYDPQIEITTQGTAFQARQELELSVRFKENSGIENALLKIAMADPLAAEISGKYRFPANFSAPEIPAFTENSGFMVSGKVVNAFGAVQKDAVVVLSIADDPPYFDYYYTGPAGDFHFFLKDARGPARVVLQVVSESDEEFFIRPQENFLTPEFGEQGQQKQLLAPQMAFVRQVTTGNFMHKLFFPKTSSTPPPFNMPPRFPVPFYGMPSQRVTPAEYIDLPNFQEISRELLPGFQFRQKKGNLTFRMINVPLNAYFDDEPLRLINGIPVFKNSLLAPLKSTDIRYIDLVQEERVYGDLRFAGIISLVLHNQNNLWMAQQPGIAQFNVECLQPHREPHYEPPTQLPPNHPDIRQTFYWQKINPGMTHDLKVRLSDLKGKVEISVEGTGTDGKIYKASKIIEVK